MVLGPGHGPASKARRVRQAHQLLSVYEYIPNTWHLPIRVRGGCGKLICKCIPNWSGNVSQIDLEMIQNWCENHPKLIWKSFQINLKIIQHWCENHPKLIRTSCKNDLEIIPNWSDNHPKLMWKSSQIDLTIIPNWFENHPKLIWKSS